MDNNLRNTQINEADFGSIATGENKLLRASFSWMAVAMLLTAGAAYFFASIPQLSQLLFQPTDFGGLKPTMLAYGVMFAPLAFILAINFGLQKMSYPLLIAVFLAFSVVMGMSMSSIFFTYKIDSILNVFLSTTALFAIMAIAGYTTKTDLTKMGSLLMIGVIGIVVASLINFFLKSSQMDYIISILGVIIFTGLTAYDVQKIKIMGQEAGEGTITSKLGIMGALTLYLDFINLFMFLLRLFGGRKD